MCGLCPASHYSETAGSSSCTPCQNGFYAEPGSTACSPCPSGTYSNDPIAYESQCTPCPAGYFCPGGLVGPVDQILQCPFGTYQGAAMATNESQCAPCPSLYYCPTPAILTPCPLGTTSAERSTSQLQCMCRLGYTCVYKKLIQAVVTLYMSQDQFKAPNTTNAFLEAVAAAAGVDISDVNIVSVLQLGPDNPATNRRLLQDNTQRPPQTTHIQLQVHNSVALRNLDLYLENAGLGTSASHNWFSPHSVQVRRIERPLKTA